MVDLSLNNPKSRFQNNRIPLELIEIQDRVFEPLGLLCSQLIAESESADYRACSFKLNNFFIRFRVAKITPTKSGQFVTIWKRLNKGPIQPYDSSDSLDFLIINTSKEERLGQFIFPKSALCHHDVFSINSKGGKRAIRVYPPWDITESRQARKTQEWQLEFFLEVPKNTAVDISRANLLYKQINISK